MRGLLFLASVSTTLILCASSQAEQACNATASGYVSATNCKEGDVITASVSDIYQMANFVAAYCDFSSQIVTASGKTKLNGNDVDRVVILCKYSGRSRPWVQQQ